MTFSGDGNGLQNADDVLFDNMLDGHTLKYEAASQNGVIILTQMPR